MADSFQLKAILSAVDKLSPVLKGVQGVAKNTRKYLGDLGNAAGNLAGRVGLPLAALGGIASGGLLLAAKKAVMDFASSGAALDDMSKRTGLTASELQLLAYQGEMSDVSLEALMGSVGKLNRNIGDAVSGKNKDLAALFQELRINLRGSNGEMRTGAELLPELADAFSRNTNAVTRARLGTALFGKSYEEILPLLVDGGAGLRVLRQEWEKIGFEIPEADSELAAKLDDSFVRLRYATDGLFKSIGAKLAPALIPLMDRLVMWAAANRDVLSTQLGGFVTNLAESLSKVDFDAVVQGIRDFVRDARELLDMIGGARTVLIAFGLLLAAGPLLSVLQLGMAVGRLAWFVGGGLVKAFMFVLPWLTTAASVLSTVLFYAVQLVSGALLGLFQLLMANPIVLVIGGIALAAYMIIKHWDTVKVWFASFFDWIGGKWKQFTGWVGGIADAVRGFFPGGGSGAGASVGAPAPRSSSLVGAGRAQVGGTVTVDFKNAPAGMRVVDSKGSTPGFDLDTAVGYRGFAMDTR